MSSGRIDIVLIRLGAVAVAISAVYQLAGFGSYYFDEGISVGARTWMFVLTFLLPASIAALLWNFPATVAGKVSPEIQQSDYSLESAENLMTVGTALLGLYAFVFGLLDVFFTESYGFWERSLNEYYETNSVHSPASHIAGRITSYTQVLFGFCLMFGRRGIARLVFKLRARDPDLGANQS